MRIDQRVRLDGEPLAPAEQLLRIEVVPAGDLRHVHARLQRLRDDRYLLGIGPVAAPFRARDHLDPPWPPNGSVITTVKHMVKLIANPPATLITPLIARYVGPEHRLRLTRRLRHSTWFYVGKGGNDRGLECVPARADR